ncbi:hypothetical protein DFS33DRAFT_1274602 [Desarmillaria ectypa]|nr:hypothetical protein DFS33DRAFT_1274602 [Desarmillaria ectypa]
MKSLVLTAFISFLAVSNVLASPLAVNDESPVVGAPSTTPLLGEECGGFAYQVQCAEDLKCCPVLYWSDHMTLVPHSYFSVLVAFPTIAIAQGTDAVKSGGLGSQCGTIAGTTTCKYGLTCCYLSPDNGV